ncbi:4-hydroxythreonine-4-phosphate dehydrogenase PdxA [Leptolyngbya sp. GB1-A1]|uniref:4-hydroxythreonine-4-phosphate dehydrogenase PdxA n=1 Tax=Leptolyngbya sp. GB1-A1 TaxID=2933908 RepID=UPI0032971DC1
MRTPTAVNVASRPRLAIVLGDPAGIGTEVVLKALSDPALTESCQITLIGNHVLLHHAYQQLRQTEAIRANLTVLANPDDLDLYNLPLESSVIEQIQLGTENAASGAASFRFLDTAIDRTLNGQFDGIVTAPIAKSAWNAAGFHYPGQTELLAKKAGVSRYGMLFVARSPLTDWTLRTLLATTHISLRQVPDALTADLLTLKLELLIECLHQDFGIEQPRIAIAGLNPHSGEQGQLGREEQDFLLPWLRQMGDRFPQVKLDGLIPPDTLWVRPGQAWWGSVTPDAAHDAYLALYHDQGLIPVKLLAFDRAVNTTIGLPFVRTSPDHGTAFDIAGQGIAQATSFRAAIDLAIELAQQRITQQCSQISP